MTREDPHPAPRDHAPLINHELTRIIGCACGWRTPAHVADSDTACADHIAIARIAEGGDR